MEQKSRKKQAIALSYDPHDDAPKVIASGQGILAEKILKKAADEKIPIHKDDQLANTLSRLEIPPELYEVVAEILIFVDAMDKIRKKAEK